jgi:hypothetical protein
MDRQIKIYLDKIIKLIKNDYPLFKNLKDYGFYDQLSEEELKYVLSNVFEKPVNVLINVHYYVYDENNNRIYYETSRGKWERKEYDKNGRKISYYKNSDGNWWKI